MKTKNRQSTTNNNGNGNNKVVAAAAGEPDPLHNMGEIFQAGHRLLEFINTRPGLLIDHAFKALDMTFPNGFAGYSNAKFIAEYKRSCEYRVKEETFNQWAFHLNAFSAWFGQSFAWATPADFERYIRSKTITKSEHGADKVVQSTHDHLIDVFRTFYNWMRGRAYYSPLLDNPVQLKRIGTRRRTPKESAIFSAQEYARLLEALPWYAIPVAVCLFELGIRPGVIKRLSWSDFDFEAGIVHLTRLINKAGAAYPVLYPGIKDKLLPWSKCSGPVMLFAGILDLILDFIRDLLGREDYRDDARKTAISMRAAIMIKEDAANAEARLDEEFGNSDDVRETYYRVRRLPQAKAGAAGTAFFAVTWEPTKVMLPAPKARAMREAQIRSAGRVAKAISEAKKEFTHDASKKKRALMRAKDEQKARETLPKAGLFPDFVEVDGDWELTPEQHKALLQKAASAEEARSLLALAEQFDHEEHQMSLFKGRPDLLKDPAISESCPNETQPTETNPSTPNSSANESSPTGTP